MKLLFATTILFALEGALGFTTISTRTPSSGSSTQCNLKVDGKTVENEVKPSNNYILLKKTGLADQTEGGIILTGKAKAQKSEGIVVSVGPGKTHPETGALFDMPVEVGESVVYGKFDGTDIDIDGTSHTLIVDDDIRVKFTGDELTLDTVEVVRDTVLIYIENFDPTASDSGILIAQTSKSDRKPSTGKVIKAGPGRLATNGKLMEMEVAIGDYVNFRDFASASVEIQGENYSVVRMADILAKY